MNRHPLLDALVNVGAPESHAAWTVLTLRRVLHAVNMDMVLDRHVVDRAANLDILRRLMVPLGQMLPADVLQKCLSETARRDWEQRQRELKEEAAAMGERDNYYQGLRELIKQKATAPTDLIATALEPLHSHLAKMRDHVAEMRAQEPMLACTDDDRDYVFEAPSE